MKNNMPWTRFLPWMTAYAIAMAFLESAVVIYLRELYYPVEFKFPMAPIAPRIAVTELLRELATMVMLLAPGALIAQRRLDRFAWFCFCFGVWDIFYYVFLKAVLDWPSSLFDWDILFLVPVVWVGPVLAPCIISVGLIALGIVLLRNRRIAGQRVPGPLHWGAMGLGGAIMLYTFIEEPLGHVLGVGGAPATLPAAGHMALDQLRAYIPVEFNWWLFVLGCGLAAGTVLDLARRKAQREVADDMAASLLKRS